MSALRNRIRSLEGKSAPDRSPCRVYTVTGVAGDQSPADFVRSHGWAYDEGKDQVICFVPVEPDFRDGRMHGAKPPDPEKFPLRFMRDPNPAWRLEAA